MIGGVLRIGIVRGRGARLPQLGQLQPARLLKRKAIRRFAVHEDDGAPLGVVPGDQSPVPFRHSLSPGHRVGESEGYGCACVAPATAPTSRNVAISGKRMLLPRAASLRLDPDFLHDAAPFLAVGANGYADRLGRL